MSDDVITRDENGDLAVRTVTATEGGTGSQYDDLYARTTDGKRALRVVGGGGGAVDSVNGKTGSVEITAEDIPVGDSNVAQSLDNKVSKEGDTLNGPLNFLPQSTALTFNGKALLRATTSPILGGRKSTEAPIEEMEVNFINQLGIPRGWGSTARAHIVVGGRYAPTDLTLPKSLSDFSYLYTGSTTSKYIHGHIYYRAYGATSWTDLSPELNYINNNASTYTLESLSSFFSSSDAKLAKVYNEAKLPTTGAYTVFSLGWAYTDSENAPALLAVELATGKLYYYQGTEENCNSSAWKEFNFGTGGADDNGLEGDYCCRYGIVDETQSGLPEQGNGNQVIIPAGLVMDIPGVSGLTTNATAITHDLTATINCELFYASGEIIEATDVFFQQEEPEDGTTDFAAWWNGTEWKFKSNDTGNVFRPANAVRVAKCIFTDGNLTRLCFTGCRLLNKQEWLPLSGGTMFGPIQAAAAPGFTIKDNVGDTVMTFSAIRMTANKSIAPRVNDLYDLGRPAAKWANIYAHKINNGMDISVPATSGTMVVATPPTATGNYVLKAIVAEDGTMTTTWVTE